MTGQLQAAPPHVFVDARRKGKGKIDRVRAALHRALQRVFAELAPDQLERLLRVIEHDRVHFDAAAVGWIVWQCLGGNWITGILGGGVVLNAAFMGGMERSISLVDEYNRDALAGFTAVLQDVLRSHEFAE